jgi:hypothetical protein
MVQLCVCVCVCVNNFQSNKMVFMKLSMVCTRFNLRPIHLHILILLHQYSYHHNINMVGIQSYEVKAI